jgi:4-carboxymuconolactone decarboxylase
VATDGGVPDDDIARLSRGNSEFDGADRLVLEATDELIATHRAEPATWQRLVDELGTHQAMELIFAVGTYAMLAMAFETWGLEPPPGGATLPDPY